MKAVGYYAAHPIEAAESLVDVDLPMPVPGPRDLLVRIKAVALNPVDTKVRANPGSPWKTGEPRVLGYDASGVVEAVGAEVTMFKPGDAVFYAGTVGRNGTNAEYHAVDERLVGHKPKSLSDAEAAALPLTSITAWELLFERMGVPMGKRPTGDAILVVGGAGGVGSILIQLARRLTSLTIIATASRPETQQWCRELGAHYVIDHAKPLVEEMKAIGFANAAYVVSLTNTDAHYQEIIDLVKPQGKFGLIDGPKSLEISPFKAKSVSVHWELMWTRSVFQTDDMVAQHHILEDISALIDDGVLKTTFGQHMGTINAANLRAAHALSESGKAKGKLILEGF